MTHSVNESGDLQQPGTDGCCFIPAAESVAAVDERKACVSCQNGTLPCGTCCSNWTNLNAIPVSRRSARKLSDYYTKESGRRKGGAQGGKEVQTCNPDISMDMAWCACVVEKAFDKIIKSLIYMGITIGVFGVGLGCITKVTFDGFDRRMYRKRRERAAVFAAAQVELGFMLRDQDDVDIK